MKKLLILALALVMTLSLCACGGEGEPETPATLQVGFGKAKIQPPDTNIRLTGGGDPNRFVTGVLDYMYLTCIAITDWEGTTALFYTVDIQNFANSWGTHARKFISERTGIPTTHIFFGCTHTHSVPELCYDTDANRKFCQVFEEGLIQATDDALADRSEAQIQIGTAVGQLENGKKLAFVRHYVMNDGSIAGSNFGDYSSGYSGQHPYDADIEAQLIKFVRPAEDKKNVLMMNWPSHSTFNGTSTKTYLSADWPSPTRDYIDENSDCLTAIFLSGGGNQVPNSSDNKENHGLDYREYGAALGQIIVQALDDTKPIQDGPFEILSEKYETPSNHFTDMERLAVAQEVYDYFLKNGQTEGTRYAQKKGFMSCYEARAYVWRSKLAENQKLTMTALRLGELSMVIAPYELFSRSAQEIKTNTPFPMTFVLGYTNSIAGYIPTEEGYEYNNGVGCYEAYSSSWPKGAAEALTEGYLQMLNQLKK